MAVNDILGFARTNTGTNLLTQGEYASDAERLTGHQPGIARSKLENKVLRQVSLMAAGLAEFIADNQANNVSDSLTQQQIADYLLQAIISSFPVASQTAQGKAELATNAEVIAGTDTTRIITPAGLSARTATDSVVGIIKRATNVEAEALTSNDACLTPLRLRNSFPNNTGTGFGYVRIPSSPINLILQWGLTPVFSSKVASQLFPIVFPNAVFMGIATARDVGASTAATGLATSVDVNGITVFARGDSIDFSFGAYWLAIGY